MPKIKELNNKELKEYLAAYQKSLNFDPDNHEIQKKVNAIEQALNKRQILGLIHSPKMSEADVKKAKGGLLKRLKKAFKK